ncbi:DUF2141 domain-containing protein [Flammeovirga pacifica]|uniref:DUF2141 domain-containing protein n=1 Tax=Flammeovirga pacifica TaxID=915059 RepID=A0A1S1Z3S9_FLAPC|nr:DUF2141 domain-containing protein [Flammeovirga pacifica]OHX67813.1 hypothetical protein NH26_16445 [Flammeovirga pacifica]
MNEKVTLKITGATSSNGKIEIGIYNTADNFPENGKQFKGYSIDADTKTIQFSIDDLPEGTYAIAIWHDENEDKKLNTNWVGKPTEKYGFSNNVFGVLSPPDFEEASFTVEKNKITELTINLK